jgi:hypothetical protein
MSSLQRSNAITGSESIGGDIGPPLVQVDSGTNEGSVDRRSRLAQTLGDRLGPAVTMATTEHFNLQTARAATISEANGRASIYLAAVSSNLIALVQSSLEDIAYAQRIARLRNLYVPVAPELEPYPSSRRGDLPRCCCAADHWGRADGNSR